MEMSEFDEIAAGLAFETGPHPERYQFRMADVDLLRRLEFVTENGGFSCMSIPWDIGANPEPDAELLCVRQAGVGDMMDEMTNGWFIMGGTKIDGEHAELGVITRGKPLLYRPVYIYGLEEAKEVFKLHSQEMIEHLRSKNLIRWVQDRESYIHAREIQETSAVRAVHLYDSNREADYHLSTRII